MTSECHPLEQTRSPGVGTTVATGVDNQPQLGKPVGPVGGDICRWASANSAARVRPVESGRRIARLQLGRSDQLGRRVARRIIQAEFQDNPLPQTARLEAGFSVVARCVGPASANPGEQTHSRNAKAPRRHPCSRRLRGAVRVRQLLLLGRRCRTENRNPAAWPPVPARCYSGADGTQTGAA
jgi:hypothetical protein